MLLDVVPFVPLKCSICEKTVAKASELLMSYKGDKVQEAFVSKLGVRDDSAGPIIGQCQACSIFKDSRFRRLSTRSWAIVSQTPRKARDANFFKARAQLRTEFPDETSRHLRQMILNGLGTDVDETPLDTTDETSITAPLDTTYQTSITAESLAEIAKSVSVMIMRRRNKCLFYGRDDQWIKHASATQVRCPLCGHHYRPLASGPNIFPGRRMISMTDPVSERTVCFPAKWKVSRTDTWHANMAEIAAVKIHVDEDLDNFVRESVVSLHALLAKVATPMTFVKMDWNSEIEAMLHPTTFPRAKWQHLTVNGVWGMKMAPTESNSEIFDDWQELIGLMARFLAAANAMGSKH